MAGSLLGLQRVAGNRAVGALVVQRHSSWEHTMMGDTKPGDAAGAIGRVTSSSKRHVLESERDRAVFFQSDYRAVPDPLSNPLFKDVKLLKLHGSGLWVTYGEVNALADYLPNGGDIDSMTEGQITPILQYMRREIVRNCDQVLATGHVDSKDSSVDGKDWAGAERSTGAEDLIAKKSPAAAKVSVEDAATANRSFQSYTGLLSRNACHFPPFSWERYIANHNKALNSAVAAHNAAAQAAAGLDDMTRAHFSDQAQELTNRAWVHSGYADHFLEDSFAAGHLVNKTLVMQWFLEWASKKKEETGSISASIPGKEMAAAMGTGTQKHMAGQDLYSAMDAGTLGIGAPPQLDPQSASELAAGTNWAGGAVGRAEIVGVDTKAGNPGASPDDIKKNAHLYQDFLRNTYLQYAASQVHNYFNGPNGPLTVRNRKPEEFIIGGDDTQLEYSDKRGEEIPIEAVEQSRKAIEDALRTGTFSEQVTHQILNLVPYQVKADGAWKSLEQWNNEVVKKYCIDTLFQSIWDDHLMDAARKLSPHTDSTPNPDWTNTQ